MPVDRVPRFGLREYPLHQRLEVPVALGGVEPVPDLLLPVRLPFIGEQELDDRRGPLAGRPEQRVEAGERVLAANPVEGEAGTKARAEEIEAARTGRG